MHIAFPVFIAAAILSLTALTCGSSANAAEPSMRARPDANSIGIWKAVVPHGMNGELDNYDPIGLIAGALIKTDCAYNWRDPDDGKLYCFASPTSLVYFENWPKTYIRRAHDALDRLLAPKPGS
ncbi:MAG TPA: hypothetical protein VFJ49_00240 [Methyloceanibacter sp.]|nr:hypothetical protein [Methyloceanibacter sp.]